MCDVCERKLVTKMTVTSLNITKLVAESAVESSSEPCFGGQTRRCEGRATIKRAVDGHEQW